MVHLIGFACSRPAEASDNWEFRLFHTPDGKSLARSRDIVADETGSIWVATWGEGVHCFNEAEYTTYTTEEGLPGNWVRCIEVDSLGRIWVGTGDGLARIGKSGIERISPPSELGIPLDDIYLIERVKDPVLWIADNRGNLLSYEEGASQPWSIILDEKTTGGNRIDSLAEEADGTLWVALRDRNLICFDGTNWYPSNVDDRNHWLGIGPRHAKADSLLAVNRHDKPIYRRQGDLWVPFPDCGRQVNFVTSSPDGIYYAGTSYGVYRFLDGQWTLLDLGHDVGRPQIDVMHFARDGSLWIGTREGLIRGYSPSWTKIEDLSQGFSISKILFKDPDTGDLMGVDNKNQLIRQHQSGWVPIAQLEIPGEEMVNWTDPRGQSFWVLLPNMENRSRFDLAHVSLETGKTLGIEPLTDYGPDLRLFMTSDGSLWLLTDQGVYARKEAGWVALPEDVDYPRHRVHTVQEINPGTFYLGLENGFERWEQGRIHRFGEQDGVNESDAVHSILSRANGEIWFGTFGSGIYVYDGERVRRIDSSDGLLSDSVSTLFETRNGDLWIAYRWIGAAFRKEDRWINFSHPDGLPNNPVTRILEDAEGSIYLSTHREGVFGYHPETDPPETEVVAGPNLIDPHGVGVFSFAGWDAWNKTPPKDLTYSWRILASENRHDSEKWSPFQNETFTVTEDLDPGEYLLEVRAADRLGNTDLTPASMSFTVSAPFYSSPLFWTPLALLMITVVFAGVIRTKVHERLLRSNQSLQVSEERFRILVDHATDAFFLHDFQGRILDVNRQACESLGYSREELLQLSVNQIECGMTWETVREFWKELTVSPLSPATREGLHRRKDGSTFPVEIKAGMFSSDEHPLILSLVRDVTERFEAERALREKDRLFREAIEIAGAVPYYQNYEPDSYSYVGKQIVELTGLTPEGFTNKEFSKLIQETIYYGDLKGLDPPDAVQRVKLEEGLIWRADYRIITKDGREKWLSNAAVQVRNEKGEVQGSLGILQDITEQKQFQQEALSRLERVNDQQTALKELATLGGGDRIDMEETFKKIVEVSSRILSVRHSSIWLFNEAQTELKCVTHFRADRDEHCPGRVLRSSDCPNYFLALMSDRVIDAADVRIDPRTAEIHEAYLSQPSVVALLASPIHLAGRIVGVVCQEHTGERREWGPEEISFCGGIADCAALTLSNKERKEVQEALEFSEERFRSFIEHSSEGIFCFEYDPPIPIDIDPVTQAERMVHSAILVECNDAFAMEYGEKSAAELIGKRYDQFARVDSQVPQYFRSFVEAGYRVVDGEHTEKGAEGATRYFLTDAHGVVEEGRLVRIWGIDRDITQRKKVETELENYRNRLEDLVRERTAELEDVHKELVKKERLATLGQLIATVSHEMRNPLGTIRGSFFTIKDKVLGLNSELEKTFVRIERNILRCDRIIEELLDFTRIRNLDLESVDLDPFLEEVVEEFVFPPGVELVKDFGSQAILILDRERVRRCLINILNNACDAMVRTGEARKPGPLLVKTRLLKDRAEIQVEDSGEGIPAEILTQIFEPLFSTKGFGIGLGIPIAKQIMENHNGGIHYVSQEGVGTRVTLWFPTRGIRADRLA